MKDLPSTSWEKIWLAYDNMCQLVKLKASRQALPLPVPYKHMWTSINKVIDSLHVCNHKDKACHAELHPSNINKMYPEIKNSKNTQAAEQTFVWLGRYKKVVSSMTKTHHLFYIHRMARRKNAYSVKCYKYGRKPVLPGIRNSKST